MSSRLLAVALAGALIAGLGCRDTEPLGPDPAFGELGPSLAKNAQPVEGRIMITAWTHFGKIWWAGPTFHTRGHVFEIAVVGDITGIGKFEQRVSNRTHGYRRGTWSGPIVADVEWQGVQGTFAGHLTGNFECTDFDAAGGCAAARSWASFVAQGQGDLKGYKWHAELEGWFGTGVFQYTGYVQGPRGA